MSDVIATIAGVVGDPLVVALFLLVLEIVASRLLFKSYPIWRALARLLFFSLLTLVLLGRPRSCPMSRCVRPARPWMAW